MVEMKSYLVKTCRLTRLRDHNFVVRTMGKFYDLASTLVHF